MKCNHRVWDRIFGADDKEAHGLIPLIWPRYFHSKCNRTGWSFPYPVITLLRDRNIWFKAKPKKNICQLQKRELRKAPTQTEPPMQLTTRSFCDATAHSEARLKAKTKKLSIIWSGHVRAERVRGHMRNTRGAKICPGDHMDIRA